MSSVFDPRRNGMYTSGCGTRIHETPATWLMDSIRRQIGLDLMAIRQREAAAGRECTIGRARELWQAMQDDIGEA